MKSLAEQLFTYKQQHTKKITRITHYIGVPAIVFSIMMLFSWIRIDIAMKWQLSFTWILLLCILTYYFVLNVRLAICATAIMVPLAALAILIARPAPTPTSATLFLVLFIGGWILQFVGHFFEQQKPAFLLGITQLLIAPLFVLIDALEAFNLSHYFIETPNR